MPSRSIRSCTRLGRDLHPERPYQDPRVSVHIEDGRSFLHDADQRYDLVLYAIPDSLTVLAGQSSLRLESYLLTREAMQEVREHLKPNGVVSMYHYYLPVVVDRYADALTGVFGEPPCLELSAGSGPRPRTVLTAGMRPDELACDGEVVPARRARGPRHRRPSRSRTSSDTGSPASTWSRSSRSCSAPSSRFDSSPVRSRRCDPTSTCSSWAPHSCCSRRRTWCGSRCCSGPPGS